MKLLDVWRSKAYDERADRSQLQPIWNTYFALEKGFYQKLLPEKDVVKGTVKELSEKYDIDIFYMTGILDGINDSLVTPNPIEDMEEDTMISLEYDKELLYKNMVAAGADWLYNLEEWNEYFSEDEKKALYKEQKASTTIVKETKVYPNDPCPCGSGKKYKKCCGKNA
ncbi:MAG: SEC-C domain-containing protein [Lachnospiraceae bacterium]|nr:SEC-C domain-containing protein [Lachnospiraceae bacterium]